ncbi:unnamed protein product [Didymodactylos carnosus]|uniref:Integrase zinc-binding domain-containing protein n=1 Tax=Didymodactylos carnosus TaxID=1234261 RepID=A0A814BHH2_9BILA|nr:unnamed protein product [Didymodactylos carnosus]CAF3707589.1 unnamed protein product [Didymodactylos carnosus]
MIPNLLSSPPQLNVTTRSMTKATASTYPTPPVAIPHPTSSLPPDFSIDRIKRTEHSNPTLYETIQQILADPSSHPTLIVKDKILYKILPTRRNTNHKLLYVPPVLVTEILEAYHDHPTAGHLGTKRTYQKLKTRYFWPKTKSSIDNHIASCTKCAKFNIRRTKTPGKLLLIEPPKALWRYAV